MSMFSVNISLLYPEMCSRSSLFTLTCITVPPRLHMSALRPPPSSVSTSGARKYGVPHSVAISPRVVISPSSFLDAPKSASFTVPERKGEDPTYVSTSTRTRFLYANHNPPTPHATPHDRLPYLIIPVSSFPPQFATTGCCNTQQRIHLSLFLPVPPHTNSYRRRQLTRSLA